jgi:hypothetical protein
MSCDAMCQCKRIIESEARRDKDGHIILYHLPHGDGGGKWEYAGMNDRYHPIALKHIMELLDLNKYDEAEEEAVKYIKIYTDRIAKLSKQEAVQYLLRDTCWNRGYSGAVKILQMAIGVCADGLIGGHTQSSLVKAEENLPAFIENFRAAREEYEREFVKRDESSKFWKGLVNRWNDTTAYAEKLAHV